jgi:multiple sugar transport system substrate-binding protein
MRKKVVSTILAVATMAALAGCGSSNASETATNTESASSATAATVKSQSVEKVEANTTSEAVPSGGDANTTINLDDTEASTGNTVTIWTWDYDNTLKMADAFNAVYPNIKIEVVNVAYSDYYTKIQQAVASGSELPDIVAQSCTLLKNYGDLGIFEDLSKAPYNVDSNAFFDYIKDRAIMDDGTLIGVEESVNPSGIAYKRDLAKKYFGTDDPDELSQMFTSLDDFITHGEEVQEKSGGEDYMFHSPGAVAEMLYFMNATQLESNDTIYFSDKMSSVLEYLTKFRDNKIMDTFQNGTPQANATYADDHHIFYPCPNWVINYYIKPNDPDGSGNWGIMTPPGGGYSCGGTSLGITNTSDAKEDAFKFIHWCLMTKDGAEMMKDQLNFFVPIKSVYEDPDFLGGGDEFFGGQNINDFFYNKLAPSIKTLSVSRYDQTVIDIRDLLATAISDDPSLTAEDALNQGLEEAQSKITDMTVE